MPYTLVKIITSTGLKKEVTAPDRWIQEKTGNTYLRWPNHVTTQKVNELLADEHSMPTEEWTVQKCVIMCRNMPSLESASIIKKCLDAKTGGSSCSANTVKPNTTKNTVAPAARVVKLAENGTPKLYKLDNNLRVLFPVIDIKTTASQATSVLEKNREPTKKQSALNITTPAATEKTVKSCAQDENLHDLLSFADKEHAEDPLGTIADQDVKPFPQLFDLMLEIRSLIKSNQEEIRKQLYEGFYRLQQGISSLVKSNILITPNTSDNDNATPSSGREMFHFDLLTSVEQLTNFNERLKDTQYLKQMHDWVDFTVGYELNPHCRVHEMVDLIFDKKFFATMTWAGSSGSKHAFKSNKNVLKLFEYIATTPTHPANSEFVATYISTKLKSASKRTHLSNSKKTKPHFRKRPRNSIDSQDNTVDETMVSHRKPENLQIPTSVAAEDIDDNSENEPSSSRTSIPCSEETSSSRKTLIVCTKALDAFENQLNDEKKRKQMHNWIDNNVGHVADREQRMKKLLDRLVDKSVLESFSWTGTENSKRALMEYSNFVRLFEYATRTVLHQTVIVNHAGVASFFTEHLKNIGLSMNMNECDDV